MDNHIGVRLGQDFYTRGALDVAPDLVGKLICRRTDSGEILRLRITETECYLGESDLACHASKGRTPRTEIMYQGGGVAYIYLIYGLHWLLNVITGAPNQPQAVLIRACADYPGPARLTKYLGVDKNLNGADFTTSNAIWFEDDGERPEIVRKPRVGIDYAGAYWANIDWRFVAK